MTKARLQGGERDPLEDLTRREREILELIAEGLSNRAIRERLHISAKTLERHIRHIFAKLDLAAADGGRNPRVCAVLIWRRSPSGGMLRGDDRTAGDPLSGDPSAEAAG